MSAERRRTDPTVPEADAHEQARDWDDSDDPEEVRLSVETPESDALDQARPAQLDEEEHG
jgi:hypothetical protein